MIRKKPTKKESFLNEWGLAIVFILIGFALLGYGIGSKLISGPSIQQVVEKESFGFDAKLLETWEQADPANGNCKYVGATLREVERLHNYNFRLYLVVPDTQAEDGFVLAGNSGLCWKNGNPNRPILADEAWFRLLFSTQKKPERLLLTPIEKMEGKWETIPVKDEIETVWAALLAFTLQE